MSEARAAIERYEGETAMKVGAIPINRLEQAPKAFAALRAVLAEHADTGDWCSCDLRYPCPTVRAITTALEAQ
jgi:hypothetical protein